jgi:hypothetical protein
MTAVNEIDNATSPRANRVKIFDVTPPGAAAMIISPNPNSGVNWNVITIKNATKGNIID